MKFVTFLFVIAILAIAFVVSAKSIKKDKIAAGTGVAADTNVSPKNCRYDKGPWSECDSKTRLKTRQLTLRKNKTGCQPTITKTKKCKKVTSKNCKYEKGTWTECTNVINRKTMTVNDRAKSNNSTDCDPQRQIVKKCKKANHKKTNNNNNKKAFAGTEGHN